MNEYVRKIAMYVLIGVLSFGISFGFVEATTIKVLVRPDEGNIMQDYSKRFEEETGIRVEVDFAGWDKISDKTLSVLLAGGADYDVVFLSSGFVATHGATGQFEPLDDLIPEEKRGEWLPAVLDGYTYKGELIGIPWYTGAAHMVYNAEYLEMAGIDPDSIVTWDDFLDACRKIKETGVVEYPYMPSCKYPGNWIYNFGTMALSMGGEFFDEDLNPVFNSEKVLSALELLVQGVEDGVFDPAGIAMDDYETLKVFLAGRTAFLLDSTWSATQTTLPEESSVYEHARLMLIPGSKENDSMIYAGAFGIMKSSKNKEAAKEYIMYITSEEPQIDHAIFGANLPTRTSLFEDPIRATISEQWPFFEGLTEQVKYGILDPHISWIDPFRRVLATAVQEAISGRKTPKEALDSAYEETLRLQKAAN